MDYSTFIQNISNFKLVNDISCLAIDESNKSVESTECSCCLRSEDEGKRPAYKYDPLTASSTTSFTLCDLCVIYLEKNYLSDEEKSSL